MSISQLTLIIAWIGYFSDRVIYSINNIHDKPVIALTIVFFVISLINNYFDNK